MAKALHVSRRENLKQLLWFNRIFMLVTIVGMGCGIYFTIGTVWVTLPVTIGVGMIFCLLLNNTYIGEICQNIK